MTISHTILDAIGKTPLLDMGDGIFAKCEFLNPSGSIKARMAKYMIEKAEAEGLLKPGDTIVEATSGNTGNAMSMVAAIKGYHMIVVMPAGYTSERVKISRGLGAEVKFVGRFQVNDALRTARELGAQKGYFCPRQFDNEWNVEENREWLGQEVIAQLPEGMRIDAIVQGVGTGGTLIGVSQALRQGHNDRIKVYAMEPTESRTIECCIVADHQIEGISDGFIPTIYQRHRDEIDEIIHVESETAIEVSKRLGRERGLFVGPSSGANVWAAQELKRRDPGIKTVLTFLCDEAEKYLSLMYS
ncbi:Pyridoxal-5'-phosphate-dependent protein beta subunit [Nitrosococcus halophilus Nc 4]|uniref:Cysteine synthase B n=1 Tax=Nitrosococcus halophilus (strain Nc4) TaxID=472759 RepID=D5C1F9_NITHN|nr:cysteine synthase family protein [Nitrosococcus halophilus]ADE16511.1 Pyridoxal-5'-phosphate-dependent protein beta subunit [Nitrosococcus halophilus Nc 4]